MQFLFLILSNILVDNFDNSSDGIRFDIIILAEPDPVFSKIMDCLDVVEFHLP